MRFIPKFLFILLLLTTCAAAQTVEGTVINSLTGTGLGGVQVDLVPQAGEEEYSAVTDAQGHFLIDGLKIGSYIVRYRSVDYFRSDPPSPPRPFPVSAGNTVKLEAHMAPAPHLTVHVVDGGGEPVKDARVEFTGPGLGLMGTTKEDGVFEVAHIPFVPHGACILSVIPPLSLKPPTSEPGSDGLLKWTRTFYPGVTLRDAALKIVLSPGEVRDIEIKLQTARAHALRGFLLMPDGTPAEKLPIRLFDDSPRSVTSTADGAFEFPDVEDGEWQLSAKSEGDGAGLQATQWVEMTGHVTEGVKLRLSWPFTVTGKMITDAPQGVAAVRPPRFLLVPHTNRAGRESDMPVMNVPRMQPDATGNFSVENTYPGAYHVEAETKPPAPYYLDTILVGDADVSNQEVAFTGPVSITFVYKTNGGTVRGAVANCASGQVWLVPQETAKRGRNFLRSARCDARDRYEITAIRPGGYYAIAFAGDDGITPWYVVLLDGSLHKRASSVSVSAGETSTADLKPTTSPYP